MIRWTRRDTARLAPRFEEIIELLPFDDGWGDFAEPSITINLESRDDRGISGD
jgi:hypothetical protein